ncbi:DNA cytosine methyltransferase [Streptomyces sp. NPDC102405]|uniref:DNA cytosine methyltransferase n=1 Tax=Streptomyces sp. NPDC102405 TaxID=3366170 RepID=UPI0037F4C15A
MSNLSLCSGAGTLDLAVEQITGNKTLVYAENDPFASRVMAAHFPWATNLGDITRIDWADVASQWQIETVSAGFPCRNISNAGRRDGINGQWSRIWKNVFEAVRVIRPPLVFLENVEALRSKDRGLDVVAADLAAIRYDLRWTCLRASDVKAPHQRWRWFGIAYPADAYPASTGWHGGAWDLAEAQGRHESADRGLAAAAAGGTELALLPTPAARDWKSGASNLMGLRGEGRPLNEFVVNMLKGSLPDEQWISTAGIDYGPAIRRWENVLGRSAPAPVERGPRGGRALSARFTEWMQGNDEGWITDVDIPRNEQIKIAGNQAMTRQAVEGYRRLLCADLEAMAA